MTTGEYCLRPARRHGIDHARSHVETGAADILLPRGVPFPLLGMVKHLAPGMPLAA